MSSPSSDVPPQLRQHLHRLHVPLPAAWCSGVPPPAVFAFLSAPSSTKVRLVCAAWKAVHDALVRLLVLRGKTTDDAMGMLVRRFLRWCRWS
jgi:hypothetical protein